MMEQDYDLELLLGLDGASYEAAAGYVVEFTVQQTDKTAERPHGINYALVFRSKLGGKPYVKFDNAHRVEHQGGKHVQKPKAFDHWHRTETDPGRPYQFTTSAQLLEDFWSEVKRVMNEKGIPNDL
jgi:Family of unknown function (DUF6516)